MKFSITTVHEVSGFVNLYSKKYVNYEACVINVCQSCRMVAKSFLGIEVHVYTFF